MEKYFLNFASDEIFWGIGVLATLCILWAQNKRRIKAVKRKSNDVVIRSQDEKI